MGLCSVRAEVVGVKRFMTPGKRPGGKVSLDSGDRYIYLCTSCGFWGTVGEGVYKN